VDSFERFAQHQRIIEEFASQGLAGIPTDLGRLKQVAMFRDVSSGRYSHPALRKIYSEPAVHQALFFCHEELLQKLLERPLVEQEWDLRLYLLSMEAPAGEVAARWLELEFFRLFVPCGTPAYLRELFLSNLRVTLGLIIAEYAAVQSAA
jgi:hypothetical protein